MKCAVGGQEFLTTHACPSPIQAAGNPQNRATERFALFPYLRGGRQIVRRDDAAIRWIKDDSHSFPYGIFIGVLANTIPFLSLVYLNKKAGCFVAGSSCVRGWNRAALRCDSLARADGYGAYGSEVF
jgi:hypothetical protein